MGIDLCVLICKQVFHSKPQRITSISILILVFMINFHFYNIYIHYYVSYVVKLIREKCHKNISNKKLCKINKLFTKNERIWSNYSPKSALHFNERASLFDRRALGQSRRIGGGWISPNRKLLLISFIYIKKKIFFFQKGHF